MKKERKEEGRKELALCSYNSIYKIQEIYSFYINTKCSWYKLLKLTRILKELGSGISTTTFKKESYFLTANNYLHR